MGIYMEVEMGLAPKYKRSNNKDFRNYYKRRTRANISDRLHEYDNDRILSLFWKKSATYMVERRAGVVVDKIGYFFVYGHPFKFYNTRRQNIDEYRPTFLPTDGSIFRFWLMDYEFIHPIVKNVKEKTKKKGYRYLNLMNALISAKTLNRLRCIFRKSYLQ